MNGKRPYMDYQQCRAARRLVHECCNYDNGNCILLDNGEPCVCVQSISYSLICRWFRNRGKYCPDCAGKVRRQKEADRQRKRYHLSTHLGYERSL